MTDGYEHERAILEALTSALRKVRSVKTSQVEVCHPAKAEVRIDASIDLSLADEKLLLLVEIKKHVFPRDTDRLLWQMSQARKAYAKRTDAVVVPLIAAEAISIGARERLRTEEVGFFDIGGSLYLPAPHIYIDIERPVPKAFEKNLGSIFNGKRAQVLHALLIHHRKWMSVGGVVDLAQVSVGTASETLSELERLGWVTSRGQGPSKERRLEEPGELLDEYRRQLLNQRRRPLRRRYYVPGGDGTRLARRLGDICERFGFMYALTAEIAAQCYAPFLTSVPRVTCRIAPGIAAEALVAELNAKLVSEGANLEIIDTPTRGEMLFREWRDDLHLASPVQIYLDLVRSEGRAKELAEHLRKEILSY